MIKALIVVLTIAIFLSGKAIAAPLPDPTKPYVEEVQEINLKIDIFADGNNSEKITNARWQVSFIKTYPNNSNKNWAMIEGKRVGVGSAILGGRVVSLSKKRLEIQKGHEKKVLVLLKCNITNIGRYGDCIGMYYTVYPHIN
ncbi:MAG: hypothetical protein HQL71_08075 [Magnetococcales bacterium]|nr:hypothetical protein [Magnetococcales bacterium]